jgi:ABC-2 type transport system permease protein
MIDDIRAVLWKEWKEILAGRGLRGGLLNLLILVGVFGVFLPLQFGRTMVESPLSLLVWAWVPPFLVISVVADAFAGERERHTLETLLASRLPDPAILLGKIAGAVSYGWGISMICLALGLISLNLVDRGPELLLYPPLVAAGIVVITFLTASITAALGVLLSLRAATVRQVQQVMSLAWMGLTFGIGYGTRLVVGLLPRAWAERALEGLRRLAEAAGPGGILLLVSVVLALVLAALLGVGMRRFRRGKLLLIEPGA